MPIEPKDYTKVSQDKGRVSVRGIIVSYLCAQLAVYCTLTLFTNNDIIQVRPESTYNTQICITLSA